MPGCAALQNASNMRARHASSATYAVIGKMMLAMTKNKTISPQLLRIGSLPLGVRSVR
nr:hypothetical protein [uncultured Undibacterium sp.]